jgi:hypothetical protein
VGTYTLSDFRTELLFDLKNRSDTSSPEGITTTRQTGFINAGLLHICEPSVHRHREMRHSYTIPLVSGVMAYDFTPTAAGVLIVGDPFSIAHVSATTDDFTAFRTKLFARDEQYFQERSHVSGGQPRDYFTRGNQILVSPIPGPNEAGEVLSVTAWREPAVLALDTDRTVLSTKFDEIVLLASVWRAQLHLGYRQLAESTKVDFTSLLNEYADHERRGGEDWSWSTDVRTESYMDRA